MRGTRTDPPLCFQVYFLSVLRTPVIWVRLRMRIFGSVPLTNGSECGSREAQKHTDPDPDQEHRYIYCDLHHSSKVKSHKETTKQ
jgi:hypothetical protein